MVGCKRILINESRLNDAGRRPTNGVPSLSSQRPHSVSSSIVKGRSHYAHVRADARVSVVIELNENNGDVHTDDSPYRSTQHTVCTSP